MKAISDWQPIETAPKDGRVIIVWPRDGKPQFAFYKSEWYQKYLPQKLKENGGSWKSLGPHYESNSREHSYRVSYAEYNVLGVYREPTHWMPLPEPPSAEQPMLNDAES